MKGYIQSPCHPLPPSVLPKASQNDQFLGDLASENLHLSKPPKVMTVGRAFFYIVEICT